MPIRLDNQSADFAERFRSLLSVKRESAEDVEKVVRGIVADVAAGLSNPTTKAQLAGAIVDPTVVEAANILALDPAVAVGVQVWALVVEVVKNVAPPELARAL